MVEPNQISVIKEKGNLRLHGITSEHIVSLLEKKHWKDVFIPECKNGETWGVRDLLKIDAWVLRRTYSPLTTIGYEIKCTRNDFEQDQKWTSYLDLCHEFYFVCPAGLIRATDLPAQVGIIWASKDRLFTKHKAERQEPDREKLNRLLIYVMMARAKIMPNMYERDREDLDKLQKIRDVITRAKEREELAHFVRGHVQEMYQFLTKKGRDLTNREYQIKNFETQLARLGITWDSDKADWRDNERVRQEIALLKNTIDLPTLENIRITGTRMVQFVNDIKTLYKDTQ